MGFLKKLVFICCLLIAYNMHADSYWDPSWGLEPAEGGDAGMIYISRVMGNVLRFELKKMLLQEWQLLQSQCQLDVIDSQACKEKFSELEVQLSRIK